MYVLSNRPDGWRTANHGAHIGTSDILSLSPRRARQLQRLRRRTWMLIALCVFARGADAALGLNLIEHTETVAAQEAQACPASQEHRI